MWTLGYKDEKKQEKLNQLVYNWIQSSLTVYTFREMYTLVLDNQIQSFSYFIILYVLYYLHFLNADAQMKRFKVKFQTPFFVVLFLKCIQLQNFNLFKYFRILLMCILSTLITNIQNIIIVLHLQYSSIEILYNLQLISLVHIPVL